MPDISDMLPILERLTGLVEIDALMAPSTYGGGFAKMVIEDLPEHVPSLCVIKWGPQLSVDSGEVCVSLMRVVNKYL